MVGNIYRLQHKLLADWTILRRSASRILCWRFSFILCNEVLLWALQCGLSPVFSGMWLINNQRCCRCRTVLHPWSPSFHPWNWCVPMYSCIYCSSGYGTRRHGCCCHHCENACQIIQSLNLTITLWRISEEIFSRSFSDFTNASSDVTVGWVRYLC